MPESKMKSIKNAARYEALREKGFSKESAAKITNAASKGKAKRKK